MSRDEGSVAEAAAAWAQWRDIVGQEQMMVVAELLQKYDVGTYAGMAMFLQEMVVNALRGSIDPTMLKSIMPYVKELQTTLYMMHKETGTTHNLGMTMRHSVTEILQAYRPVEGKYTRSIGDQVMNPELPDAPKVPSLASTSTDDGE